jgi:hypothetical protein
MVLAACLFISCHEKSVELKESFTIPSTYRPGNIFNSINSALIDEALAHGQDTTLQIGGAGNLPLYEDIEFYPVLSAKDLHRIVDHPLKKNEFGAYVDNIDFNTHFAFIVAHPDSYEATYFDELTSKGSGKGLLKLQLDSRGLGKGKTGIEALMQKWKIKVYTIERKSYDSLTVQLNEDTYPFRIK